jgi:segregation and condensation protein B
MSSFSSIEPTSDLPPLALRVEAALLTSDRPLSEERLAEVLELGGEKPGRQVEGAIAELNAAYERTGRSFRIERLAGGWRMLTLPAFGPIVSRLQRDRQQSRLSPAALETLAIIAYRQPVLRTDIETIRGVACGEVLRGLMERRLVKIVGRAEELGRPMLYGTTREFLSVFGLAGLDDLPQVDGAHAPKSAGRRAAEVERPIPEVEISPIADAAPTH